MIPAITKLYLEEVQRPLLSEIISGDYTVRAGGIVDVDGIGLELLVVILIVLHVKIFYH